MDIIITIILNSHGHMWHIFFLLYLLFGSYEWQYIFILQRKIFIFIFISPQKIEYIYTYLQILSLNPLGSSERYGFQGNECSLHRRVVCQKADYRGGQKVFRVSVEYGDCVGVAVFP